MTAVRYDSQLRELAQAIMILFSGFGLEGNHATNTI